MESTAAIAFHIDTGADRTLLIPSDAQRAGLAPARLGMTVQMHGLGGALNLERVPGVLGLTDGGWMHLFRVEFGILPDQPEYGDTRMASLLGRDVLDRVALHIDPCHDIVQLDIHGSDEQINLPGTTRQ